MGGYSSNEKGMEIWNPKSKTVELLWDDIPPEQNGTTGLEDSRVVTLRGGRELLLYGGYQGSSQDGIWKYVPADNTWKRYNLSFLQL